MAAVGSWLFARAGGGRWLVRMEDLDAPRVVPGSAEEVLEALQRYGLRWDGDVVFQSRRTHLYDAALATLRARGLVYECGCSRTDIQRAASAPLGRDPVYPGTCRNGLPPGRVARAIRFRAPAEVIAFDDRIAGRVEENVAKQTGDFVVARCSGWLEPAVGGLKAAATYAYAYQLAVVVDDAEQGVTQVVRGGDLLSSTARQIALQRALDLPMPEYAHLPLIVGEDGSKLGKRDGALPLSALNVGETLKAALQILGVDATALDEALTHFDPKRIPRNSVTARLKASG